MPEVLETADLERLIAGDAPPRLVDVRLADDHEAARLPGAVSNCVFEVAFLDRMAEVAPDRAAPVCVYGHGLGSMEAEVAADKLERAGWTAVHVYEDGVAGWREAGHALEEGEPVPRHAGWPVGERALDVEASEARWLGRNLLNSHEGTVGLARGSLTCTRSGLTGGEIVFDLNRLTCDDLAGRPEHDVLIAHLQSDDFFDTGRHPEAVFTVTEGCFVPGSAPGAPNLEVDGVLRVREVSARVAAVLTAGTSGDGRTAAQGTVVIDRTRWNVLYGSGRYFARLAGHLVNDEIELRLRLVLAGET